MNDPRISQYRQAVLAMQKSRFAVEIPADDQDEVGRLGQALSDLGQRLERKTEEINEMAHVTGRINAGLTLDEVLDYLFDSARAIIPYHRIGLALLEEDGKRLRSYWHRSDAPAIRLPKGYSVPMKSSSLQQILETGQPRILNDLEEHLREHPKSDSTRRIVQEGMRSSLTCPLIVLGRPIGFVFFSSMEKHTYQDAHVEIFLQIAGQLAITIEKSRLYQRLAELNELKNKFLGIVAHDLRNPIGVIQGFTLTLLEGVLGEMPEEQREVLQVVHENCETMLILVNDLLDVSAIEAGQLELHVQEVDLTEFLQSCYRGNELLARTKSIQLKLELPPDLPRIRIDPHRLRQVMGNLITNAIKFSHPETVITMRARVNSARVEIAVADQGQGIPKEDLPRLFSPFAKASVRPTAGEKSTGLGLAISKQVAEAHGGEIRVQSKVGVGSTFTFSLPLQPE